jgi:hypothetical protein
MNVAWDFCSTVCKVRSYSGMEGARLYRVCRLIFLFYKLRYLPSNTGPFWRWYKVSGGPSHRLPPAWFMATRSISTTHAISVLSTPPLESPSANRPRTPDDTNRPQEIIDTCKEATKTRNRSISVTISHAVFVARNLLRSSELFLLYSIQSIWPLSRDVLNK